MGRKYVDVQSWGERSGTHHQDWLPESHVRRDPIRASTGGSSGQERPGRENQRREEVPLRDVRTRAQHYGTGPGDAVNWSGHDELERRIRALEKQVEPNSIEEGEPYSRIHCANASCGRTVAVQHMQQRTVIYHQATYHIEIVPKPGTMITIPCKWCGVGYRQPEPI